MFLFLHHATKITAVCSEWKKEKSQRADELKPLGHMSLPLFYPKPLSLFSTESEDSAVLLTRFYSSFLQLLRRVHENTFF